MQSYLGAGALCQICFEPFGQLEELKAPYAITCGHVFCVGCLNNNDPCCRICGVSFDRQTYSRLLALNGQDSTRASSPLNYDYDQLGQQLQQAIGLVNEYTNLPHLHHLHERARLFLDPQPRNRFRDLDTSVRLLGCLLQAKDTLEAQSMLLSALTEKVHRLNYEKSELQDKFDEMDRRHAYENAHIMDHIPDLMRKNPDFNLLTDEVIAFRTELNDLKSSVDHIRNPDHSPSPTMTRFTPKIRVHPASRSPSPDASPAGTDVDNPHGLSPLPYGFSQLGPHQFDTTVDLTDIPNLDPSTASDSSDSDTPLNATLSDSDSDSDAEPEGTMNSGIHMLSEITFSNEQELETNRDLDILRQTGYVPALVENMYREASVIHQPQAIYPGSNQINSVRFNLDIDEPSIQSPNPDLYPDSPGSDIDSIMAMSCSSLPILKTPANYRLRELEQHLPPRTNSTALRDGSSASISPLPNVFSNIENLKDLLSDSRPDASTSKIANSTGPRSPTRILSSAINSVKSGTLGLRGPSTMSRAVTRSKSFPNLLSKRPVSNEVRSDAMPGQARLVAEMRSCLIEVIARVFVHFITDGNGQVPTPSAMLPRTHTAAMYASRGLDSQAQPSISAIVDALDDGLASASRIFPSTSSGPNLKLNTNHSPPSSVVQRRQTPS